MRAAFAMFAALILPLAAQAEDVALPPLQTCVNTLVDQYEWQLTVTSDQPIEEVMGGIWDPTEVTYCGTVAIVRCDRSDDPIACQRDLEAETSALAQAVRTSLPAPETLAGETDSWPRRLYDRAHALAHGISAGDDCAGSPEIMEVWCRAREANHRLRDAVLAWQVARYLGVAEPAVLAGWAGEAPPVRPRPRP